MLENKGPTGPLFLSEYYLTICLVAYILCKYFILHGDSYVSYETGKSQEG